MCVKFNAEEQNKLGVKGTHTTCVHSYQKKKWPNLSVAVSQDSGYFGQETVVIGSREEKILFYSLSTYLY